MGKKDDLIAEARGLGIELDSSETIADLEAKIAQAEAKMDDPEDIFAGAQVKRHKVNRGSRRRIERALAEFEMSSAKTIAEMNRQAFLADEDGNKVGEWPAVADLRAAHDAFRAEVNALLASE